LERKNKFWVRGEGGLIGEWNSVCSGL